MSLAAEIDQCHYRTILPREQLRAQRFPDHYIVLGNRGEQTMQAGNAVPVNLAHWIGSEALKVL
jgi:DNA (cytosine-5)-methyltransferase 1